MNSSPTQLANIQYQKDLVKKNEEIAELKAGFHELQEVKEELKDVPYCKSLIEKVKYIKGLNMEMGAGLVPELKEKIKELDLKLQVGWFDRDMKIIDLKTDNDVLKADYKELKAKMNLTPCLYAVQYEKDLVKKNEEIAELKAENEKLKDEDKCVMDMLEPAIKEEVALLKEKNEELKILTKWLGMDGGYDKLKAENEKLKGDMSCMVDKELLSFRLGYGSLTEHFDWEKVVIGMRKDAERFEKLYTELSGKSPEVGGAIWLAEAEAESKKAEEEIADICVGDEDDTVSKLKADNEKLKAKEKSNTGWLKLTKDNAELKADNKELQDRLDKIQEWMSKEQRAFGSGAVNSFWNAIHTEEDEDSEEDSCGCGLTDNCYCDEDSEEDSDEDYDWPATHQLKDVKVGEGDVGWEKY